MRTRLLTVRLTETESRLIERLHAQTGLSKSALVRQALHQLSAAQETSGSGGLFALGAAHFGRHGAATRQSAQFKRVVRDRWNAKRTG